MKNHAKAKRIHTVDRSMTATYMYYMIFLYKTHELRKNRTQLFGTYLCNPPHHPKM